MKLEREIAFQSIVGHGVISLIGQLSRLLWLYSDINPLTSVDLLLIYADASEQRIRAKDYTKALYA